MQRLAITGNFRELSQDELYEVNGGILKILVVGTVTGAAIGCVHAWRSGEYWLTGAGTGAAKGMLLATAKVMFIGTSFYKTIRAGYWAIKAYKAADAVLGE